MAMSKSGLQAELSTLKSNAAFLTEFLATEVYQMDAGNLPEKQAEEKTKPVQEPTALPSEAAVNSVAATAGEKSAEMKPDTATNPTSTVSPVIAKKNYEGKYVIWTSEAPSPAERLLIKKIIAAVNIPAARLVLETNPDPEGSDWSTSAFVFAFGVATVDEKHNLTTSWKGTRLLKTCTLAELDSSVEYKKSLWAALKATFGI